MSEENKIPFISDDEYLSDTDELDTAMDIDFDESETDDDIEESEDEQEEREAELAATIVNECQGVDENGRPKAILALSINKVSIGAASIKTIAQAAFCNATVAINGRYEFVEFVLDFKSRNDPELKLMWNHLQKYGKLLEEVGDNEADIPTMTMVLLPLSGLGSCYMTLTDPTAWYLSAAFPGEEATRICLLTKCESIEFYETDEIDLSAIHAEVDRAIESETKYREAVEKKIKEEDEFKTINEDVLEAIRKGGIV